MTELLLETDLHDEQLRMTEVIKSCGRSLLALINDVLDVSKIEAQRLDLEEETFDLRVCVDDVAKMLAVEAQKKKIELIVNFKSHVMGAVRGDSNRISQILVNLLGNAVKVGQTISIQKIQTFHFSSSSLSDLIMPVLFRWARYDHGGHP